MGTQCPSCSQPVRYVLRCEYCALAYCDKCGDCAFTSESTPDRYSPGPFMVAKCPRCGTRRFKVLVDELPPESTDFEEPSQTSSRSAGEPSAPDLGPLWSVPPETRATSEILPRVVVLVAALVTILVVLNSNRRPPSPAPAPTRTAPVVSSASVVGRPSNRVFWHGYPDDCYEVPCLLAAMRSSGAGDDAIHFAEKLSGAAGNYPTWAIGGKSFGNIDLVVTWSPCMSNCSGGFFVVDRDLRLIDVIKLFAKFRSGEAFPRNTDFVGTSAVKMNGREMTDLLFQSTLSNCMACEPAGVLEFAVTVDKDGHVQGHRSLGVIDWANRKAGIELVENQESR